MKANSSHGMTVGRNYEGSFTTWKEQGAENESQESLTLVPLTRS